MNRRSVQFAVVFLLLLAGLSALIRMPFVLEGLRDPLCAALARAASGLLGVFGVETVVSGTQIRGATGVTEVVYNCDGVGLLVIFLSATLAFPVKRLASIAAGIAFGTLVILAINVVRIAEPRLPGPGGVRARLRVPGHPGRRHRGDVARLGDLGPARGAPGAPGYLTRAVWVGTGAPPHARLA